MEIFSARAFHPLLICSSSSFEGMLLERSLMAISAFIGRQTLHAAVIVGVLPALSSLLPAQASLLPPASRAQLIHTSDFQPSRAIPYVITPERRAMLNTIRFAEGLSLIHI